MPIPRNAKRILRRLYGEDCLTRYVACKHLGWPLHEIQNTLAERVDDYRLLVLLCQLMSSIIHSNIDPIRLARIANRSALPDRDPAEARFQAHRSRGIDRGLE